MPVPTVSSEPFGFEAWCQKELSRLLKFSVGEDLIRYVKRSAAGMNNSADPIPILQFKNDM